MKKVENKTEHRKSVIMAQKMLEKGKIPIEDIAEYTGLSCDEVKELAEHRSA